MNDLITKFQSELPGFSKGQKQSRAFYLRALRQGRVHDREPSGCDCRRE